MSLYLVKQLPCGCISGNVTTAAPHRKAGDHWISPSKLTCRVMLASDAATVPQFCEKHRAAPADRQGRMFD